MRFLLRRLSDGKCELICLLKETVARIFRAVQSTGAPLLNLPPAVLWLL